MFEAEGGNYPLSGFGRAPKNFGTARHSGQKLRTLINARRTIMDINLKRDAALKLEQLTEHPDIDLHLRIQDHRIEGIAWCQGRRYRLLGVRDEEPVEDLMNGQSTG
jgi:hypothetical protein